MNKNLIIQELREWNDAILSAQARPFLEPLGLSICFDAEAFDEDERHPDRLAITDHVNEVIDVITTPTVNPEIFRRRVKCLMLSGLSQAEAEKFVASTPLQLELFYDIGLGAFAIDADAVGNTPLYNPYTGEEIPDET